MAPQAEAQLDGNHTLWGCNSAVKTCMLVLGEEEVVAAQTLIQHLQEGACSPLHDCRMLFASMINPPQ